MPDAETLSHAGTHKTQFERFKSLQFTDGQWIELSELAKKEGLVFLSTPFDEESADFLDKIVPAFKIASGDLTNLPLIEHVAKKGKPIILSTGLSTTEEIEKIVEKIPKDQLILLHCIAAYPTPIEEANLRAIPFLKEKFKVPVGYSDHTIGNLACEIAVALGACVIEKHFTFDKNQPFGDHKLSADPGDMRELIGKIREIEKERSVEKIDIDKEFLETILGKYEKKPVPSEKEMIKKMRRSLHAAQDIPAGALLKREMMIALRPADGISPLDIHRVIGKTAKKAIKRYDAIKWEDLE